MARRSNPMVAPEPTEHSYLALGAGVQSSCVALKMVKKEIVPMVEAAIFADTGAETDQTYEWLDWLEKQLPFPVHRVSKGNLRDANLPTKKYLDRDATWVKSLIPFYVRKPDGGRGQLVRGCTRDFKIRPIAKKVRQLAKIRWGQKELTVTQVMGISWDEAHRMKDPEEPWMQNRWPLVEQKITRDECIRWMKKNYGKIPPRSACYFCPYHSDTEWKRLKTEQGPEFEKAVRFEHQYQELTKGAPNLLGRPFLHRSAMPLEEIVFADGDLDLFSNMEEECDGMCGV